MMQAPDLPAWAALIVALLILAGATTTLIGSLGLLRLNNFYERVHAPTLGSTLGMALIVLASMICFSALGGRFSIHELLIALFLTATAPVAFMLLARSALYRDRAEGRIDTASERGDDAGEEPPVV